ncbi:MAG: Ribosome-binding factor A [Phycisphaerae bacterium]|nr:Ribosome-binding factor A [Phycisphaerae bacterium]
MNPYRREKMASTIRTVLAGAIGQLNDPRIEPLTSVTRVEVSADLLAARVYVVVHGSRGTVTRTLAGLRSASGHLQRVLASELQVRQCPRVSFELDEAFVEAQETLRLIASNEAGGEEGAPDKAGGELIAGAEADDPSTEGSSA